MEKADHGDSTAHDHRTEERAPITPRRDPRADPDDDALPVRVDVVQVDRPARSADPLTDAALSLRRELARLHQQAAAVERTIEEQRRERSEAYERHEHAQLRAKELEARVESLELDLTTARGREESTLEELQKVRSQRDELARSSVAAEGLAAELAQARRDVDEARAAQEESRRTAAVLEGELAEIRNRGEIDARRASDHEAELERLRERAERLDAELATARDESAGAKAENLRLREEAEAAATALAAAQEGLGRAEGELDAVRREAAEARSDAERLRALLATARRERDAGLERATAAERQAEDARRDHERLERALEVQAAAAQQAETRAVAAERTRAAVEQSVHDLRDEVIACFARWRAVEPFAIAPSASDASAALSEPAPVAVPPPAVVAAEPEATAAPAAPPEVPPAPDALILDDEWLTPDPSDPPPPLAAAGAEADASADAIEVTPPSSPVSSSVPPPSGSVAAPERQHRIEQLADPSTVTAAATALLEHPEWLRGRPPLALLEALTALDYDVDGPVFELARMWERDPLARALVAALRDEPDAKLREHSAWLLKQISAPSVLPALIELVSNDAEPVIVRRWLIDAIERLVASRSVGWKDVGVLVSSLLRHPDASLRDGAIGVVAALERSDEKRRVLLELLRVDDDETVLSSAVQALASALPIELDPALAERLLGHRSPRVQRSVVDFIERSKRVAPRSP
jgi:hypothetical protein